MPFELHTTEVADGSTNLWTDRLIVGVQANVANVSGAEDTAVTTAVEFVDLPANASNVGEYGVQVTPSQPCFVSVTDKTATGFNVVLTPISSTGSIAAGTFDVLVFA